MNPQGDLTPAERLERASQEYHDAWKPRPVLAAIIGDTPKHAPRTIASLMKNLAFVRSSISDERMRSILASKVPGLSDEQLDRLVAADPHDLRDPFPKEVSPEMNRAFNEFQEAREARIASFRPSKVLVELVGRRPKDVYVSMFYTVRTFEAKNLPEAQFPRRAKELGIELDQLRALVSRPASDWEEPYAENPGHYSPE